MGISRENVAAVVGDTKEVSVVKTTSEGRSTAKCDQNIRAGTHEAVRRELVAKNPGGGVGGRRGGHLVEEGESREEAGSQRTAEEARGQIQCPS